MLLNGEVKRKHFLVLNYHRKKVTKRFVSVRFEGLSFALTLWAVPFSFLKLPDVTTWTPKLEINQFLSLLSDVKVGILFIFATMGEKMDESYRFYRCNIILTVFGLHT